MTIKNLKTIGDLDAFLKSNQLTAFSVLGNKTERYEFVFDHFFNWFCEDTSDSDTKVERQVKVDDLQFLISKDGRVVVADPLDVRIGVKPSKNNLRTINLLIKAAEDNL